MKVTNLIRLALIILFSSCAVATIGLISENKISDSYDEIEQIRTEKKLIKMWKLGFNTTYADAISSKLMDADFYLVEQDNVKEINRCIRNWQIAKRAGLFKWAIDDYPKFQVQKFYNPIIFNEVKATQEKFSKWDKTNSKTKPCLIESNRVYINKTTTTLYEFYPFYLSNMNKIQNVLNEKEFHLYQSIENQSSKAANYYLFTFIILLLSTFIIVISDVKSNRGQN